MLVNFKIHITIYRENILYHLNRRHVIWRHRSLDFGVVSLAICYLYVWMLCVLYIHSDLSQPMPSIVCTPKMPTTATHSIQIINCVGKMNIRGEYQQRQSIKCALCTHNNPICVWLYITMSLSYNSLKCNFFSKSWSWFIRNNTNITLSLSLAFSISMIAISGL